MDFLKVKLRKVRKSKESEDADLGKSGMQADDAKVENVETIPKAAPADPAADAGEDEDDDDFITNEVKRRLKELRKNSFMVLIPEDGYPEDEEGGESSSSEWRESEVGDGNRCFRFDTLYDKYCECMLFFDKLSVQHLKESGRWGTPKQSPRSASRKLALSLRSLSMKKRDGPQEDYESLHQPQEDCPYQTLEIAYVAQVALCWEALHCQYMQLSQMISFQSQNSPSYNFSAQAFQQFQVLLQRFIENEPFELGSRVELYAHTRYSLPKLLQVPKFQGIAQSEIAEDDFDQVIFGSDLIKVMEDSILTFRLFLKKDKNKSATLFGSHSSSGSSIRQVQASLEKKETKLKELFKKKKGWKKKTWPATAEEVELLLGLIDIKVTSRVLRMARLHQEQLLWCEEKLSKLDVSGNKLRRDGSPLLFPC